ncbi:serine threonine kinase [Fusarium acutatum]|uniref:Serine threonine kinase n=1 Tax=Fusarium acutatum TaxID=78861 RepID=A0A8H4JV96_9HYPO|nr:serine threonine kinase [Fusarium acutatum]
MPDPGDQYTIGWICALDAEMSAAVALLGHEIAPQEECLRQSPELDADADQGTKRLRGEITPSTLCVMGKHRAADNVPFIPLSTLTQYWADQRFNILVALKKVCHERFEWTHDWDTSLFPFYDFGDTTDPLFDNIKLLNFGGTAEVSHVKLKHFFLESGGGVVKDYAVKKLLLENWDNFRREVDAHEKLKLAQSPHPHIVPLLASYRTGGKYHLIFPLARCDLARYWRTDHVPILNRRITKWFASQMAGLAHALSTIHLCSGGSQEPGSYIYGVHGDIKPANILCFGSDDREPSLALTDFGSSYFLTPKEKEIPRGLKHTPVYRAPEVDTTTGGITQAYDIWSLGCVFLEAIVWFLDGKAGIAELTGARLDQEDNSPNRDAFFRVKLDKRGGLTAKVKPEVQRVLISLSGNPWATPFSNDMLYLVMDGMLKIDMNQRMSAREIFDALTRMCMKLEEDPAYSQPRDSGDVEMAFSCNTPSTRIRMLVINNLTKRLMQITTPTSRLKVTLCKGKCICLRCYTGFETDALLQTHAQQEPPCSKTKLEAAYGILSGEQAAQIHSLKRKSSKETEEDRWFYFYRMVSPTFNQNLENISPYHESNSTSLGTLSSSTSSNVMYQYRDYLRNRGAEEYAAKLAKMDIDVTLEVAAKLLESQVKDLETFDETMREPFRAYGFETDDRREQAGTEESSTELTGSSDLFSPIQRR